MGAVSPNKVAAARRLARCADRRAGSGGPRAAQRRRRRRWGRPASDWGQRGVARAPPRAASARGRGRGLPGGGAAGCADHDARARAAGAGRRGGARRCAGVWVGGGGMRYGRGARDRESRCRGRSAGRRTGLADPSWRRRSPPRSLLPWRRSLRGWWGRARTRPLVPPPPPRATRGRLAWPRRLSSRRRRPRGAPRVGSRGASSCICWLRRGRQQPDRRRAARRARRRLTEWPC